MCMAANNAGGILGVRDLGSTFMWVKLKTSKVPSGYNVNGLKSNQFEASNDLYGSFCRVRVTLQSDDKFIQEKMRNKAWTTAYFAVGDAFTCGSWIPESDLREISEDVAKQKTGRDGSDTLSTGQKWGVAGASILSAIAGAAGTDLLQSQTGLGGLLKTTANKADNIENVKSSLKKCKSIGISDTCTKEDCSDLGTQVYSLLSSVSSIEGRYDELGDAYDELYALYPLITKENQQNAVTKAKKLKDECTTLLQSDDTTLKNKQDKNFWNNGGGRLLVDATGAGLTAAAGGITTAQIMRESNRTEFTAAQKEWMDNIGRHITCYIGGDEAGSYGDIITTSLE